MTLQQAVHETFAGEANEAAPAEGTSRHSWRRLEVGGASLRRTQEGLRLAVTDATTAQYSDAQIDDYADHSRRDFLWRPPLTLQIHARFSQESRSIDAASGLLGTAGFGFWNDPFSCSVLPYALTGKRPPAPPRAIWFFYASPPSDMKTHMDVRGNGWKAATVDARRRQALPLAIGPAWSRPYTHDHRRERRER